MSTLERRWPRCPECGGKVEMRAAVGRTREYRRGVALPIPADFELPTCTGCAEVLIVPEVSTPLDALLGAAYRKEVAHELGMCVTVLKDRHGVTQQDIEDACGVTRSYLSHLLSGRKEPSLTLMKLIRSFVLAPNAFEHARTHEPLRAYLTHLFDIARPEEQTNVSSNFGSRKSYRSSASWAPVSDDMKLSA